MTRSDSSRAVDWMREAGMLAAFFAVVWLSGEEPLTPRVPPSYIAILFVPVAVLFLALMLRPARAAPAYALTFVAAIASAAGSSGYSVQAAAAYALVDVLEVFVLVRLWHAVPRFLPAAAAAFTGTIRMICMTLACGLTAIPATGAVALFGSSSLINFTDVLDVWLNWLMGDLIAYLVIALPLLVMAHLLRAQRYSRRQAIALALYALLMFALTLLLFWPPATASGAAYRPLALYLPFPILLFGAVAFTYFGAALGALFMAVPAIQLTTHGHGPFAWPDVGANVLHFQTFLWIACLSSTVVADLATSVKRERDRVLAQNSSLREANRVALAASRARSDFLGSLSHELRTPLNAIRGFAEMIERQVIGPVGQPRYVDYARDIGAAGLAMQVMVEELLRIAALDAGRDEGTAGAEPLNQLIVTAARAVSPDGTGQRLRLRLDTAPTLVVPGAPQTVAQILTNLLANAMQYSPVHLPVTIRAKSVNGRVIVEVRDRGPGLAMAFDASGMPVVESGGDAWVAERKGLGLGLRLCKVLCDRIGAELEFIAREGGGTTARVIFPNA